MNVDPPCMSLILKILLFSAIVGHMSRSYTVASSYLKFSNQLGPPLKEATSFATLKSRDLAKIPSRRFTICGSIYIGFYRGYQIFYTVQTPGQVRPWFALTIDNQDTVGTLHNNYLLPWWKCVE